MFWTAFYLIAVLNKVIAKNMPKHHTGEIGNFLPEMPLIQAIIPKDRGVLVKPAYKKHYHRAFCVDRHQFGS